ncbi:MAG: FAD-dependent oxidoreductase [Oscillospiraceae bacterium]
MIYDVIVAGAGPSGFVAALSAARNGAKVLLIDKNGFLGGMNTAGLVGPLMTFHSEDRQVVKGIAQEIVDRLVKKGGCLGHIPDPIGVVATITPIEPELLKQLYFEMVAEEPNLQMLLHTFISNVDKTNEKVKSITCVNKSGTTTYEAKFYIDATGDGDVAALAKAKFEEGRKSDDLSQPMTMMFKLGGVDYDQIRAYIKENPEQFILGENIDLEKYVAISGYFDLVTKAKEHNDFHIMRDRVLLFQGVNPGEAFINMSRVIQLRGTNADDLTQGEIIAHKQIDEIVAFLKKYINGFENSYLLQSGSTIGVRETRRFKCKYSLTLDDVLQGKEFEDGIAACAFPIDIHDPKGSELAWVRTNKNSFYTIPYRTMLLNSIDNMIVTGRCIGASHEAMASSRVSPTAMALGEAAGAAAALAIKESKTSFSDVDVTVLRALLKKQGAVVDKT